MSPQSTASQAKALTPGDEAPASGSSDLAATSGGVPPEPAAPSDDDPGGAAAAIAAANRWGVLQHTHYRNVLFAQVFSNIGTWTEMFAIQMFVAQKTGRLDDQGALGVAQQLPIFFLGIMGGLTADRVNRRTLLVVTQLMAGVVAAGVALVATYSNHAYAHPIDDRTAVHLLLVLGALNGCVMAFNFPAWQVLTPRLVPRAELTDAITLNGIQFNFARIVGPSLAGLVLAHWGAPPLLWFNSLTFVLMACVVMTTPDDPVPALPGETSLSDVWAAWRGGRFGQAWGHWLQTLRDSHGRISEAWRFLIHNRGPRAVLLAQVLLCFLAAPMVRMLSNFVIDVYKLQPEAAKAAGGYLLGIQGLGAVVGGVCLRFVPKWYPKHHFIPLSVAALGLSISLFALTRTPWVGYLAMAVCGWFWMWAFNQSWAAIQVLVPDQVRGRAMSITNVAAFGAMALGALIAGVGGQHLKPVVGDQWATQSSILMLSVPLLCAGVVMMLYRVPEVDEMPAGPVDARVARSIFHAITAKEHWPAEGEAPDRQTVRVIAEQEPM